MKNVINYILIGFIQGITEFLPISSSGHIVLFGSFLMLDNLMLISIVAHVGTLFAVLFCYRTRIKELIKNPRSKTNKFLILATIPTIIVVLLFNGFIEDNFSVHTLVWGFLISAVLLLVADLRPDGQYPVTTKSAIYMGLAQGCALLPGISRSGTTLVAGMIAGVEKNEALDFSFIMSIPIIFASAIYESIKLFTNPITVDWLGVAIVLISSFIFGVLSIKIMLKVMKKNKLFVFSIYLVLLSFAILIF